MLPEFLIYASIRRFNIRPLLTVSAKTSKILLKNRRQFFSLFHKGPCVRSLADSIFHFGKMAAGKARGIAFPAKMAVAAIFKILCITQLSDEFASVSGGGSRCQNIVIRPLSSWYASGFDMEWETAL